MMALLLSMLLVCLVVSTMSAQNSMPDSVSVSQEGDGVQIAWTFADPGTELKRWPRRDIAGYSLPAVLVTISLSQSVPLSPHFAELESTSWSAEIPRATGRTPGIMPTGSTATWDRPNLPNSPLFAIQSPKGEDVNVYNLLLSPIHAVDGSQAVATRLVVTIPGARLVAAGRQTQADQPSSPSAGTFDPATSPLVQPRASQAASPLGMPRLEQTARQTVDRLSRGSPRVWIGLGFMLVLGASAVAVFMRQ